jgi:hypothetical protein
MKKKTNCNQKAVKMLEIILRHAQPFRRIASETMAGAPSPSSAAFREMKLEGDVFGH